MTWCLETHCGASLIAEKLQHTTAENSIGQLELDKNATPPSIVNRAGTDVIEAFLTFNTSVARCRGILRLSPDKKKPTGLRAWTFFTAIDALVGFEEKPTVIGQLASLTHATSGAQTGWINVLLLLATQTENQMFL